MNCSGKTLGKASEDHTLLPVPMASEPTGWWWSGASSPASSKISCYDRATQGHSIQLRPRLLNRLAAEIAGDCLFFLRCDKKRREADSLDCLTCPSLKRPQMSPPTEMENVEMFPRQKQRWWWSVWFPGWRQGFPQTQVFVTQSIREAKIKTLTEKKCFL